MPVHLVFEGELSDKWGVRELLEAVSRVDGIAGGVLRIDSPEAGLAGRISIAHGRYITGAALADGGRGYEALKRLLSARTGKFAFLDASGLDEQCSSPSMHISAKRLISLLPDLPPTEVELFDEESILDEVFGLSGTDTAEPARRQPAGKGEPVAAPIQPMAPLMFEPASKADSGPLIGRIQGPTHEDGEQRITFGKLKSLASRSQSHPFIAILTVLLVLSVILASLFASGIIGGGTNQMRGRQNLDFALPRQAG